MRRWFRSVAMAGAIVSVSAAGWAAPAPLGPVTVASPDGALVVSIAGTGAPSAATWRYRLERQDATPGHRAPRLVSARADAPGRRVHDAASRLGLDAASADGLLHDAVRQETLRHQDRDKPRPAFPVAVRTTRRSRGARLRRRPRVSVRVSKHVSDAAHRHRRSDGIHRSAWLARVAPAAVAGREVHARVRRHVLGSRRRHRRATSGRVVVSGALPSAGQRALDSDHGSRARPEPTAAPGSRRPSNPARIA